MRRLTYLAARVLLIALLLGSCTACTSSINKRSGFIESFERYRRERKPYRCRARSKCSDSYRRASSSAGAYR